jgi:hypothetical protein
MKKLLCLPLLVALSQGCSGCTDVVDSGSSLQGWGFASDTTAILFYEQWENINSPSGFGQTGSGTNYLGWELQLVDIRFQKVYWKSRINHSRRNTQILVGRQWNDSTMLIELTGEGYWLWTVGNRNPKKISFNWNTEIENYDAGVLLYNFRLRPWKNYYFILFSDSRQASFLDSRQAIIDSKTMIVNDWFQTDEDTWTTSCDDFWWINSGGVCLFDNSSHVTLLSEKGDTLGIFSYTGERLTYYEDTQFTIDRQSSYWIFGKRNFVDSLRNAMEY